MKTAVDASCGYEQQLTPSEAAATAAISSYAPPGTNAALQGDDIFLSAGQDKLVLPVFLPPRKVFPSPQNITPNNSIPPINHVGPWCWRLEFPSILRLLEVRQEVTLNEHDFDPISTL